ncbi:BZ3500_MvSof-1268-A1-R1_Chr1-2g01326 [Microbotryum saponariae]|uniref:Ribosome biogenesis protein YTM1 n=1 Tax=Microbotryum saponariae TaxID=289078 RepID=A0A2X0MXT3_9BASI|nr:BZ3500_MvSof-1268-A1-R1_Chr1-2g01326 [Microbotryum saponariae]SCZ97105.1 BZ3501_MvSof-1269-A2-R1_Chr1-2g00925 [Microbotryum saponariae]
MSLTDTTYPSVVESPVNGDAPTTASTTATGEERQIAIRLTTQDAPYEIPATKFLVPASWRRFHLSQLINKVLNKDESTPFDFLINQTLLRSSLGAYCAQSGVSEEVTLEIEYLPSTLPPQLESTIPSQDWVSDISLGVNGVQILTHPCQRAYHYANRAILSSSYAGTLSYVSTLDPSNSLTFHGHDLSVLSCCYVHNPAGQSSSRAESGWIASGGMDRVARVWSYSTPSTSLTNPTPSSEVIAPSTLYTLSLHTGPVSSIRARPFPSSSTEIMATPHLLTGGWDGVVGVWDLTKGVNEGDAIEDDGQERKKKRRRAAPGTVVNKVGLTPVSALLGHTGKISRAIFSSSFLTSSQAYSASYDHTLRTWDLSTAQLLTTRTAPSSSVLLDLAQLSQSTNLLITGSTDRSIGVWDTREDASSHISISLTGHTGPVSSVVGHPKESLLIASGSYDSTVKIWDVRSPKQALFSLDMPREEGDETKNRVLALDWDGERLVAAGEGAKVAMWRVSGTKGVEAQ